MPPLVKQLLDQFFPGLGASQQAYVGLANVGITVVNCTLALNTARTDAQVIASPPNTGVAAACGPIVHSLGIAPTISFLIERGVAAANTSVYGLQYQFITADNSAVYVRAITQSFVGQPIGGAVTLVAVR